MTIKVGLSHVYARRMMRPMPHELPTGTGSRTRDACVVRAGRAGAPNLRREAVDVVRSELEGQPIAVS